MTMTNGTKHEHNVDRRFIHLKQHENSMKIVKQSTVICKELNALMTNFEYRTHMGCSMSEVTLPCGRWECVDLLAN